MSGPVSAWMRWPGYGLLFIALLLFAVSMACLIRARTAAYYIVRQRTLRRAQRCILASLGLLAAALLLLFVPSLLALTLPPPTP
ncbi:MAG: hypothetical protein N2508_08810, partial [Anaerolineae bacterium]|nr:hypothetical protein [Anaerolineae bacterium]